MSITEKAENIPCDEEENVGATNIADMERWRAVVDVALDPPPRDVPSWNEGGGWYDCGRVVEDREGPLMEDGREAEGDIPPFRMAV